MSSLTSIKTSATSASPALGELSELLPVVHWYGFDELFRGRCPEHAGRVLYQEFCSACEARRIAASPGWSFDDVRNATARKRWVDGAVASISSRFLDGVTFDFGAAQRPVSTEIRRAHAV